MTDALAKLDAAFCRADAYLAARADAFNMPTVLREHGPKIAARLGQDNSATRVLGLTEPKPEAAVEHMQKHDPSGTKHAYTSWMAREYGRGNIQRLEDMPAVHDVAELHMRHKARLPVEQRDISKHSYQSLREATKPFRPTLKNTDAADSHFFETGQAKLLHDSPEYRTIQPLTEAAACHFGKGTDWCTAWTPPRENQFNEYKAEGPLYISEHKPTGDRWQLHNASDQLKDKNDEDVDGKELGEKHPEIFKGAPAKDRVQRRLPVTKPELDKLVNSKNLHVRYAVAEYGLKEHLDKLVNDPSPEVRTAVARHGHKEHLDKLINDPNNGVRAAVARHGHKEYSDMLVNDPDAFVRGAVATHTAYKEHLDKLVNDPDWITAAEAKQKLQAYR